MIRCSTDTREQRRNFSSISLTTFPARRPMPSRPTTAARPTSSTGPRHFCRIARNASTRSSGRRRRARTPAGHDPSRPTVSSCCETLRISWRPRRSGPSADGWRRATIPPTWPSWPGSTPPCLPVLVGLSESGIACESSLTPRVLDRTGIRVALAYLRIGNDPEHIRIDDLRETIRRPSRRIAPNVIDMLTSPGHSSLSDVRRLAGRLTGGDVEKLRRYASDLEIVVRSLRHLVDRRLEGDQARGGVGRCGRSSSTHPATKRIDPPTSTT